MNKNLDTLFKDNLSEYTETPPTKIWSNISESLDRKKQVSRKLLMYKIAACFFALISFGIGYNVAVINNREVANINKETQSNTINRTVFQNNVAKSMVHLDSNINKTAKPKNIDIKIAKVSNSHKNIKVTNNKIKFKFTNEKTKKTPLDRKLIAINSIKSLPAFVTCKKKLNNNNNNIRLEYGKEDILTIDPFFAEISNKNLNPQKWSFGVMLASGFSNSQDNTTNLPNNEQLNERTSLDQESSSINQLQSYKGGFEISYKVNNFVSIGSGISFSRIGEEQTNSRSHYRTDKYNSTQNFATNIGNVRSNLQQSPLQQFTLQSSPITKFGNENENDNNFIDNAPINKKIVQKLDFLEIPLNFKLNILDSKIKLSLIAGPSLNVLVSTKATIHYESKTISGEIDNLRRLNFAGNLGIGISYPINDFVYINVSPNIKYFFNSINDNSNYKPYDFTLQTSLGIRIN